ncbi:MAG TPA: S46 family peptidase, partial [Actinomycetota bacterium]|nr:S46 family peptidase [Actinomycetota bacterium]
MRALSLWRAALLAALALPALAAADEGMWTFDSPPLKLLQEKYGFTPAREWLDKVRLASVRFNDGGSGSFVSPDGLMITNHHVGLGCIQNISTEQHDYVSEGFLAPSRDKEPACPGYEVNLLMAMEDVTPRVLGAVRAAMSDKEAGDARKAATARIEKECADRTGQRCNVITLYQGAEYQLYTYKKYTDVRLVFAPEQQTAF